MTFTIITLFPEVFTPILSSSILGRAARNGKIKIRTINLRDFGIGRHRIVDDKPYGGGVGMVLRVDVLDRAIQSARKKSREAGSRSAGEAVILLDPKGKVYKQETAEELSRFEHLILVCGHYEGFDERVRDSCTHEISIGDYILSGGEIAAIVVVESVARLVKGVLAKVDAPEIESFSKNAHGRILEAPTYTRPPVWRGKKVPAVLLSGDFAKIEKYRTSQAGKITSERRPDLTSPIPSAD